MATLSFQIGRCVWCRASTTLINGYCGPCLEDTNARKVGCVRCGRHLYPVDAALGFSACRRRTCREPRPC